MDRILLVDDEVHLTNLWRLVLEITGRFTVQEENRGERVLKTAKKFRPHLIFMDRHLCGTDGEEVAAELHQDPELKSVPVVFVTGSVTKEEADLQGLLGSMPTLAKPFGSSTLPLVADTVLGHHRRNLAAQHPPDRRALDR